MSHRPDFFTMPSYEVFEKYYWYREELQEICRKLHIDAKGTKQELNERIKMYFDGQRKENVQHVASKRSDGPITLSTPLLHCGFSFNDTFRAFFAKQTGIDPFKFTANMAAAWRRVQRENDESFTLQDMLNVFEGTSDYAVYDAGACQWNQFFKDFCADARNKQYKNKMKTAAMLWRIVRDSTEKKVYSYELVQKYETLLKKDASADE